MLELLLVILLISIGIGAIFFIKKSKKKKPIQSFSKANAVTKEELAAIAKRNQERFEKYQNLKERPATRPTYTPYTNQRELDNSIAAQKQEIIDSFKQTKEKLEKETLANFNVKPTRFSEKETSSVRPMSTTNYTQKTVNSSDNYPYSECNICGKINYNCSCCPTCDVDPCFSCNSHQDKHKTNSKQDQIEKREALEKRTKLEQAAAIYRSKSGYQSEIEHIDRQLGRSSTEIESEDILYKRYCDSCNEIEDCCKCCSNCDSYPCNCCSECGEPEKYCRCCSNCDSYPCNCCNECGEPEKYCRCCSNCDSYPCNCCNECGEPEKYCRCCSNCDSYPCNCCSECGEPEKYCRCCSNCDSYPCNCCNECGEPDRYCRCCSSCNSYPCNCCNECGQPDRYCRCCSSCDSYPCRCCRNCNQPDRYCRCD